MGNLIQNVNIQCTYCGHGPILGRESTEKDRWGKITEQCRWTCDRCGALVRCDERELPTPPKEEKKENNGKDKAKQ